MIEDVIRSELAANSSVAAHVSDRIHYDLAPQGETVPYLTIRKTSAKRTRSHQGSSGITTAEMEIEIYGSTYYECKLIEADIRSLLDARHSETIQGTYVGSIFYTDESDDSYLYEEQIHVVTLEFEITHNE